MKKILFPVLFLSLTSFATIWTTSSFEEACSKLTVKGAKGKDSMVGEFARSLEDKGGKKITCFLGDNEVSSASFNKNNGMTGYTVFHRNGAVALKQEIYNEKGLLDNQEVYLKKGDDPRLVYFRIDAKGMIIDGHYMISPEMIKIIPMGRAQIAIDNGKQVSLDEALKKIKSLVIKNFAKDLKGIETGKRNFSEVVLELNRKQLSGSQDSSQNGLFSPAASK